MLYSWRMNDSVNASELQRLDLLGTVLEGLDQGLVAYDRNLQVIAANARVYEILELPEDVLGVGSSFEDWVRHTATVHEGYVADSGTIEEKIQNRIIIAKSFSPFISDNKINTGKFIETRGKTYNNIYIITYTDVTERKNIEEKLLKSDQELRENEARFRDMATAASDRFWETDAAHRFTYVSDPSGTTLRPEADKLLGKTRWEAAGIDPDEDPTWQEHVDGILKREPFREFVFPIVTAEGRDIFISVNGMPVYDAAGNFSGYRGTATDVTKREELNRLKDEFISTSSHELRTPLTSIRASLGLIVGGAVGDVPEKAMDLIKIAETNSLRLLALVNDILDMEKIEAGQLEYAFEPIDLSDVLPKAIEANEAYGIEFGVDFQLEPIEPNSWVNGDETRLNQVITNLLSNAAKFSDRSGEVKIAVTQMGQHYRLSVSDQGPGIPADFRTQIFEKFTQVDGSNTRRTSGTGLGLSISKAIVEKHDGQIDFESELGKGTTFFIDLPKISPPQ